MKYRVELKPRAIKDLARIPRKDAESIAARLRLLGDNLAGDVKKLTNFTPEYRMRIGRWRVLFEVDRDAVMIYRILHHRESSR